MPLLATLSLFLLAGTKVPVPTPEEQKTAAAIVSDIYKSDYELAKRSDEKLQLAKKLISDGIETRDDLASRYVLLRISRDIATQQGDMGLAYGAIDEICKTFDANKTKLQIEAAEAALGSVTSDKKKQGIARALHISAEEAVRNKDYDNAKLLALAASKAARKTRDTNMAKFIDARSDEISRLTTERERISEVFALLKTRPTDPSANLSAGRYLCFEENDWQRGVPMLALGSDPPLKAAAILELEGSEPLRLGDAWWAIAEKEEGTVKSRLEGYAIKWYYTAFSTLTGISRTRVEKLLTEYEKHSPAGRNLKANKVHVHQTKEYDTHATYKDDVATVNIGDGKQPTLRPGCGDCWIGLELDSLQIIHVDVLEATPYKRLDVNGFAGFIIDYHTADGYSKRVAISVGVDSTGRIGPEPYWGKPGAPIQVVNHQMHRKYRIVLADYAPLDWDGQFVFSVGVHNVGISASLRAKITGE